MPRSRSSNPRRKIEEFKNIRQLDQSKAQQLDQLRNDLAESIERVKRINQAFLRELRKESTQSNRIKIIIDQIDLIHFQADSQLQIVQKAISATIFAAKRKERRRQLEEKIKKLQKQKEEEDILDYLANI